MSDIIISAADVKNFQGELRVFDCSADLSQAHAGREQFETQHIAGAGFADINTDLSSHDPAVAVNSGRHPLPSREHFAAWLGRMGVSNHTQVVVYDRQGMNFCGRLWWMLKWLGHDAVAVLDGGFQAWQQSGGAITRGIEAPRPEGNFALSTPLVNWRSTAEVAAQLGRPEQTLIDARAPARFRGETEPLDPVAGHIPGALNRPFALNLDDKGFFKSPDVLRQGAAVRDARNLLAKIHEQKAIRAELATAVQVGADKNALKKVLLKAEKMGATDMDEYRQAKAVRARREDETFAIGASHYYVTPVDAADAAAATANTRVCFAVAVITTLHPCKGKHIDGMFILRL